tara:strand:+ start:4081 stop:4260 length:180 start_codon:yes stop_codon:yes gene_type:complete
MGKGSKRRPKIVTEKQFEEAWNNIFPRRKTPKHGVTQKHRDKTKSHPRMYKYNNTEEEI